MITAVDGGAKEMPSSVDDNAAVGIAAIPSVWNEVVDDDVCRSPETEGTAWLPSGDSCEGIRIKGASRCIRGEGRPLAVGTAIYCGSP